VCKDPYEWNNLADDLQYQAVKVELRTELHRWMVANGDEGQDMELEAFQHQRKALRGDEHG
jgi:hypothetical protein